MRPLNLDTYHRRLRAIIREDPEYWLKEESSKALFWEYIARYEIKMPQWLKQALIQTRIPSMDTISRRVREIKEELVKQELNKKSEEERQLELLVEATK